MGREHPCAIDYHRIWEQYHYAFLFSASFWMAHQILFRAPRPELEERPLADRSLQGSRTPHPLPELPLRQSFLRELLILSGGCRFNEGIHT